MSGLTDKQKVFIEAYLGCWNATEAARRAGYEGNDNTLGSVGWENLQKPAIADRIKKRLAESAMSADEVLARLAGQARADIADYVVVDLVTGEPKVDLRTVRGKTHLIKSIQQTAHGVKVELYDAQAALEKIGRAHGLFVDRHVVTGMLDVSLRWEDDDTQG